MKPRHRLRKLMLIAGAGIVLYYLYLAAEIHWRDE